jgi:threonine/homoserine/homoserine lactone efflux protein
VPSTSTLLLFCPAALVLLLIPGPSVLYIVTRSIDQGRRAGFVSVLGTHVGSLVHVAGAAFGLSALIVSSALAFSAVKYLGAAYLVWLGIRRWRAGDHVGLTADRPSLPMARLFRQGFVVQVLNPKTAIFFLAFLPQFVDADHGSVTAQVLVLGVVFIALGLVSDSTYAIAASTIGAALRRGTRAGRAERYVSSGVYIGLGVTTAVAGGHRTTSS